MKVDVYSFCDGITWFGDGHYLYKVLYAVIGVK